MAMVFVKQSKALPGCAINYLSVNFGGLLSCQIGVIPELIQSQGGWCLYCMI